MQRFAVSAFAITAAAPAAAHEGLHLHPHATSPVWLGLMIGGLILGCVALWAGSGK
ncbi:hypothetical protein BXY66_3046 [Shimia isoporae]|uniref:Peptidase M23 n=1 Tax=Shimia isoporae TaxID=647720 RepID=A0A4R1N3Z7_9RHOB|nr:hypothetical protein [Shimia isoporae]TCL00405.1 hypothetical protein BXY66_3046 [Shimia isoporae]